MNTGLLAIFVILLVIICAVWTRKSIEFLLLATFIDAMILFDFDFLSQWCIAIQRSLADNVWVIVVCGLFGSLIALLQRSKGTMGFSKLVTKFCSTERKTLLTTFVMGLLIFVDDYLNVLSIGACMKDVYDRRKIPREALAFILDSTGAPICVLIPYSTWAVYYSQLFWEQESVVQLGYESAMDAYMSAVPLTFYPMIMMGLVILFCMGWMPRLGAMRGAYERTLTTGETYSLRSRKLNTEAVGEEADGGNLLDFLLPMAVLIAVAVAASDLLVAVVAAIAFCFVLYIPRKILTFEEYFAAALRGLEEMLPILVLLVISFTLKDLNDQMHMTEFIIEVAAPFLGRAVFPAITFVLVAVIGFTTGSVWGMSTVVVPIVFPLGAAISANPVLIMAAVLSGCAFGSHACFFADVTLLTSTASGIDNMDHALTQMPYVMIGSALTLAALLVCGGIMR